MDGVVDITIQSFNRDDKFINVLNELLKGGRNINKKDRLSYEEKVELLKHENFEKCKEFVKLLRWRMNTNFYMSGFSDTSKFSCSFDDGFTWEIIPSSDDPQFAILGLEIVEDNYDDNFFKEVIEPFANQQEPLYHDLLKEAFELYEAQNLRGAYMLGYSALETAVKQYLGKFFPQAKWFVDEAQSPNIHKIFCHYMHTLNSDLTLSKSYLKMLEDYMNDRNKLVHTGKFTKENRFSIGKKLHLVKYILYKIDYCLGFRKAISYSDLENNNISIIGKMHE